MTENIKDRYIFVGQHGSTKKFYIGELTSDGSSLTGIYLSTINTWVRYNGSSTQNIFFDTYEECISILKNEYDIMHINTPNSLKHYENEATHDKQNKCMS